MDKTQIDKLHSRASSLKSDRSSWDSHWEEIARYLLPRSGRFSGGLNNDGARKHNAIYDSTATKALKTLAAGMMAGMTSPARPWFKLTTNDPDLAEQDDVKRWLTDVRNLLLRIFNTSNTYRALHSMYGEVGAFGSAASILVPDFDSVIHHHTTTIGEFSFASGSKGQINTLFREVRMTAAQMVSLFGRDKVSDAVRTAIDANKLDAWFDVVHAIEPRAERDPKDPDARNMPWLSVYFEPGHQGKILSESGFRRFRGLCPRWEVTSGDVYGHSPGMETLGDIKQLQHEQLRKAQGIDKMVDPPITAPTSLKNAMIDTLPGGVTFADASSPAGSVRTMYDVRIDLSHLLLDIQDVRERIRSCFYADLFLMLASAPPNTRMTATEVAERHEEKLLMLGPVLERLHNELLSPLIDITFEEALRAGILPPPPEDLLGQEMSVVFVSMLAQAQRAVETNGIDRFVGNLGALAQFKPDVLDKLDADEWADTYSDMLGVDPELIVPTEKVALIRQQRAVAAQQAMAAQQANLESQTAKNLAGVDMSKPTAATDVTRQFSGYST